MSDEREHAARERLRRIEAAFGDVEQAARSASNELRRAQQANYLLELNEAAVELEAVANQVRGKLSEHLVAEASTLRRAAIALLAALDADATLEDLERAAEDMRRSLRPRSAYGA